MKSEGIMGWRIDGLMVWMGYPVQSGRWPDGRVLSTGMFYAFILVT